MNKEIKTYSAEDFIRYHKGKMTNAEMRELEGAALNDPFLADAMEGYAFSTAPEADLADLRTRLAARKNEAKIIPLKKSKNIWWRAAAAVIILGSAAYFFNRFSQKADDAPAIAKTETKTNAPALLPVAVIDTPATVSGNTGTVPSAIAENNPPKNTVTTGRIISRSTGNVSPAPVIKDYDGLNDVADQVKKEMKPGFADSVYSDTKRKDMMANSAEAKLETSGAVSQAIQTVQIKSSPATAKKMSDRITATRLSPDSTTEFDRYVSSNLRLPEPKENEVSYKGTVVLSFSVNKKGKPVKIKTEKTVCGACDKEAIRLLKEGPEWEYDPNNNRKKVSIPF